MAVEQLITQHIDTWTSALRTRSTAGRGTSGKIDLYGIKKLRELILELAVRGKLVSQDPNDEPASELLNRIAAEKAELVKQGKIKKQKSLPEINEEEKPFELPVGWEWRYFDEIINQQYPISYGVLVPGESEVGGVPFVRIGDIAISNPPLLPEKTISKLVDAKYERTRLNGGEILMAVVGSIGKLGIAPESWKGANIARALCRIVPVSNLSKEFILLLLQSKLMQSSFKGDTRTLAQPTLNVGLIKTSITPIPPFTEQHRIVAKVNELMSLCDQLEQQSLTSLEAHSQLVETLLSTLTASQNAEELAENWARISEHFDTLFTTEASIDALKQTILQLAVMGKLVPQDANDEPASELLKRIEQEKAQLVKEGKIKKQKPLPPISEDEKPFELPVGWVWCRLDDICAGITSGSTPSKEVFSQNLGIPYLKVYNIRNQSIDFEYKPQFINEKYNVAKMKRSILYPGDVIMNIVGPPLGKIAIIPDTYPQWNCNQAIVFFRSIEQGLSDYIYTYLLAGYFLDSIELIGTAGQDNISVTKSRSIVLPFPPKDEQIRLKKVITEMFCLCDSLKSRLQSAQQTQLYLADALTDAALN